jgi:radial spoke head protein 4A
MIARHIKHVFTGNLNAKIDCCPPFPGKERHYLREQIGRITHGTEICPKGLYEIDEETQEVKLAEEFAMPEDIKNPESWGHKHPNLLKAGRCSHIAPEGMGEEERDEYMAKLGEEDKQEERFRGINEDTPIAGLEFSWTIRTCGDTQ